MSRKFDNRIAALACVAFALASGPLAAASDVTLEEDVAHLVKPLSRPVDTYHWAEGGVAKRAGYTRRRIELFWQTTLPQSGPVGNGLVAATDPISNRPAGDESVLFRYT